MNTFLKYSDRRLLQFDAIESIDNVLVDYPCKDVIASYLVWTRKVSKRQFEEFSGASWVKKKDLLEENLSIADKHLEDIQSRLDRGEDPCTFLRQYS